MTPRTRSLPTLLTGLNGLPRLAGLLTLAIASASLAGCSSDVSTHESLWQQKGPASYTYAFHWGCFCSPDYTAKVRITVANKAITAVQDLDAGKALTADRWKDFRTIDGLFAFLHEAEGRNAASIQVTYDPLWSYPTSAAIDYVKNAADDEMAFTASDFQQAVQ